MQINKQAVADKVKVALPRQMTGTKGKPVHLEASTEMNLLYDVFPELGSLELSYNYKEEMWLLDWDLPLFGKMAFLTKAAAVARMTTWLNNWAQGELEDAV